MSAARLWSGIKVKRAGQPAIVQVTGGAGESALSGKATCSFREVPWKHNINVCKPSVARSAPATRAMASHDVHAVATEGFNLQASFFNRALQKWTLHLSNALQPGSQGCCFG